MSIKKSFIPLIEFLAAKAEDASVTVASILEEVTAMASTKGRKTSGEAAVTTMIKDAEGKVVAIFDYYFKRWMPLVGDEAVDFGIKASSASGFASMCKSGVSHWTKQQRDAKKALANILTQVESGELELSDIAAAKEAIEADRKLIVETDLGFATAEEINDYLIEQGIDLTETDCTTE